ncbi:hypothetical protein HWB57_gp104 [Erwinia phage vB_EamM-Bue1]|uniref:Uncharacterized protein n=1 Tax=Erwinia phage vB_EamM-Bue1 TaxID=2099338 RepID=A0A2U9PEK7_9CAUD|nr:hypothetical protein HWB57_gp104 [Erwinia phage vB_EamM-Bue1]AWT50345.1 hypothetical protein [Erwinia phage vB_EamM-Bue1]
MSKEIQMTIRQTPRFVSRFPTGTPEYEDIKHLVKSHNLFTWLICLFIPSTLIMMPPEMCGCVDGVSGKGIGHATRFKNRYYGLWTEGFPEY